MFFDKLWGKPRNIVFLSQYAKVLKQSKISKDMKNFHTCDTFFKYLIDVNIIILVKKKSG